MFEYTKEDVKKKAKEVFSQPENPPSWIKTGFDILAFALVVAICAGIGAVIVALLVKFAMWIL